jgi:hypothetical protein
VIIDSVSDDFATNVTGDDDYLYIGESIGDTCIIEKRKKTTGVLVVDYGINGVITTTLKSWFGALVLEGSYLYVGGADFELGDLQWHLEKRDKTSGVLVDNFGVNGVIANNPTNLDVVEAIESITTDSDYLYLTGWSGNVSSGGFQWRIEKRDKISGTLIAGFGTNGVVLSGTDGYSNSIICDSNYIYIAGVSNSQWRIEKRDKITSDLITTFGTNGVIQGNSGWCRKIYADIDYLYIVGDDSSIGNNQWRIEKRAKNTGNLITDFGSSGVILNNPSIDNDFATGLAIDINYLYIVGCDSIPGEGYQWRIEKRNKIWGTLVSTFGVNGVISENLSTSWDTPSDVWVDTDYIYIAGDDYNTIEPRRCRIEKRSKITGGL